MVMPKKRGGARWLALTVPGSLERNHRQTIDSSQRKCRAVVHH